MRERRKVEDDKASSNTSHSQILNLKAPIKLNHTHKLNYQTFLSSTLKRLVEKAISLKT